MDTRHKILPAAALAEIVRNARKGGARARLVTGYFDPLLVSHARRLRELRDGVDLLAVLVHTSEYPLLCPEARAELVAAVAVVDYVAVRGENELELVTVFDPAEVIHENEADRERTRELIRRVHERH